VPSLPDKVLEEIAFPTAMQDDHTGVYFLAKTANMHITHKSRQNLKSRISAVGIAGQEVSQNIVKL